MTRVTVDASTAAKLHGLGQYLEFCDEAGNVLGHFAPEDQSPAFRDWLRNLDPGLPADEIERRIAQRQGAATEEVLAHLRGHVS
jgi:hypothetical protein